MIFKRIDDQTVNCIITPDDMKNHGLKIDDLFEKKEEAMEFLHMVINEARRRVNFKPTGAVTSMQMSVLPDRSISLIISEQSSVQFEMLLKKLQEKLGIVIPESFRKQLSGMSDDERIERLKEYAARVQLGADKEETGKEEGPGDAGAADILRNVLPAAKGASGDAKAGKNAGEKAPDEKRYAVREYLYEFTSFGDAARCCRFIAEEEDVCAAAELYRHGKSFYFILHYEGTEEERFNKLALSLNEFGNMVTVRDGVIAHIRETDSLIIRDDTIRTLAEFG